MVDRYRYERSIALWRSLDPGMRGWLTGVVMYASGHDHHDSYLREQAIYRGLMDSCGVITERCTEMFCDVLLWAELARSEHPQTSHDAAEELISSGKLKTRSREAYAVLKAHRNSTARELDFYAGSDDGKVRKRLNDLRKKGLAKKVVGDDGKLLKKVCSITGSNVYIWDIANGN